MPNGTVHPIFSEEHGLPRDVALTARHNVFRYDGVFCYLSTRVTGVTIIDGRAGLSVSLGAMSPVK